LIRAMRRGFKEEEGREGSSITDSHRDGVFAARSGTGKRDGGKPMAAVIAGKKKEPSLSAHFPQGKKKNRRQRFRLSKKKKQTMSLFNHPRRGGKVAAHFLEQVSCWEEKKKQAFNIGFAWKEGKKKREVAPTGRRLSPGDEEKEKIAQGGSETSVPYLEGKNLNLPHTLAARSGHEEKEGEKALVLDLGRKKERGKVRQNPSPRGGKN